MRLAVIGTGFMAEGFLRYLLKNRNSVILQSVLTRRDLSTFTDFPYQANLTNDIGDLIEADVILDCSGDPYHSFKCADAVFKGHPDAYYYTLNAEFQVTIGSYFLKQGAKHFSEVLGDQPGSFVHMGNKLINAGFNPFAYLNYKRYLNHNPNEEQSEYWAKKLGISLSQNISATDGTKLQIEQALLANWLKGAIIRPELIGYEIPTQNMKEKKEEAKAYFYSEYLNHLLPLSDYILSPSMPKGITILATHEEDQSKYLSYLDLGNGPVYWMTENYHLCHLEAIQTLVSGRTLMNNTAYPRFSVASVAKKGMAKGTIINKGIGSYELRGITVPFQSDHVPIGLVRNARLKENVERDQVLTFSDIEFENEDLVNIWKTI